MQREGAMTANAFEEARPGPLKKLGAFAAKEFRDVIPPTVFFFFGFNFYLFTKRLILADYLIQYAGFAIATIGALLVGKVVLVADKMPFLRRFDYAPLAYPILFKTIVYTLLVFVVRLIEALVHYLMEGGVIGQGAFAAHLMGRFSWPTFIATQLWIFVLFLLYVTGNELNSLFGGGELFKIFFTRPSSALKSTRRARIRLLTRLVRLTETHPVAALEDPLSAPHKELVTIVRSLTQGPDPAPQPPDLQPRRIPEMSRSL